MTNGEAQPGVFSISWVDRGREPCCPPNPDYPSGKDVDLSGGDGVACCKIALTYPAPRCGIHVVKCKTCGLAIGVATAGRADDPRSLVVPCGWLVRS